MWLGRLRFNQQGALPPPHGSERPPLTPTLQRDGRNDAAAVAALVVVVGVRPPASSLLTAVVVLGEASRTDHEAQLCIG